LLFHGNSGYMSMSQLYVTCILPVLFPY
jgi:hypothetical protein